MLSCTLIEEKFINTLFRFPTLLQNLLVIPLFTFSFKNLQSYCYLSNLTSLIHFCWYSLLLLAATAVSSSLKLVSQSCEVSMLSSPSSIEQSINLGGMRWKQCALKRTWHLVEEITTTLRFSLLWEKHIWFPVYLNLKYFASKCCTSQFDQHFSNSLSFTWCSQLPWHELNKVYRIFQRAF